MANAAPQTGTTVVLTETQLAALRRQSAFWIAGAMLVGLGVGYAVGHFTTKGKRS